MNSKFSINKENEIDTGRIVQDKLGLTFKMMTSKNLYPVLCSYENLKKAFKKASKNKSSLPYVGLFRKDLKKNLLELENELETFDYKPKPLKKFVIRDPKTRVIRKSYFKDRIVHHAIVNILEPIYEKVFIYDSYANRKLKGTLGALDRFDYFKRKVSKNNTRPCYVLKADVKQFFDSIDQDILINILRRKIKDNRVIWLVNQILKNFHDKEKGMPLGNMTSQFFANVYLNELDYFVKHQLRAKYYIRYVDDFIILHEDEQILELYKEKIEKYLKNLKLELHQDKSKIFPMYKGVNFLGYRIFYYHKLLRKRNINQFKLRLIKLEQKYKDSLIEYETLLNSVDGWLAYAKWANTYKLRKRIRILIRVNLF